MSFLITRPRYDIATYYLYYWSKKIIAVAKKKNLTIFDLRKGNVNKKKIVSYLRKRPIDLAIFNGHGDDKSMKGHDDKEIISANENLDLFKGKNVYMRACSSGKILGPKIVQSGAKGFVGYREPFIFYCNKDKFRKPLEDDIAGPNLECSNQVAISLVKGHSVSSANKQSLKVYKRKIDSMMTSESGNNFILVSLMWNMNHQVCYE